MNMKTSVAAAILLFTLSAAPAHATEPSDKADKGTDQRVRSLKVTVVGFGRPMILIPGLANSGAIWDTTVAHYKSKYECHVLTLAGFGGHPPVEGPFLETMRKGIADYVRDKKLDKPVLVGHSLGGFLVFLLGATEPDLVGPLVVVDAVPCPPAMINDKITADELKQGEQIGKFLGMANRADFLTQQQQMLGMWITDKGKIDRAMKWVEVSDQATVAKALGELWTRDLRGEVGKIKAPVLLIAAPGSGEPRTTTMKRYEDQVAKVADKKVVFAEKAKHFIMFDEPDWMWKQMDEFLAEKN
jgi:pimeloyl-ACP methyl ester carboxylesterase